MALGDLLRALWHLRRRAARDYALIRLTSRDTLFQDDATTGLDRYPTLFAFVRKTLGDGEAMRLLSFGCATGEEVASLRRHFPQARLLGIDINPRLLAIARARPDLARDAGVTIRQAGSLRDEPDGAFDAIFCLSVLRRGILNVGRRERCDPHLRFADFDRQIAEFARCLRPGGLLAVRNSNFRVRDARAAAQFEVALRLRLAPDDKTPLFGPDNRRLADQAYGDVVFRRL
jgi:SAM-dependent methyltransferase